MLNRGKITTILAFYGKINYVVKHFCNFYEKKHYFCTMAGIYIHIPFCKTRCIYCGFFSTTSLSQREAYVDAVCNELSERTGYLNGEPIDTIYFGGGTPSQLTPDQIGKILRTILLLYNVRARAEITIEGNPDDLNLDFLSEIRKLGVNRVSMGIQSFDDSRLRFLHRRHTSEQAKTAVFNAVEAGINNISIDLMFGFPGQTLDDWKCDVNTALQLPVKHISAYSLMYDEGTLLSQMLDRGEVTEIDDELSLQMYQHLVLSLKNAGFEHYEISNFSRPGYASRHNSSYWKSIPYLGVGAGAHSYDGESRQYNPDSLQEYFAGTSPQKENLSTTERYNEFVFTGLRTRDGISLTDLQHRFGSHYYDYCMDNAHSHIDSGRLMLDQESNTLKLTPSGIYISNVIMSDLMEVD